MPETLKALVVDDEPDVELLFTQRFRRETRKGLVKLRFAQSGAEALDVLRSDPADVMLVLSDINMPGMTGLELLRIVKDEFPDLRVLMVTAYDDARMQEEALTHGAEGYLTKPLDFAELKRSVFALEV
ncbi:MAG: response regulator [Rubricoccaceae bacterium]|nr:response regulator [Rubricoccaceae bacterium]